MTPNLSILIPSLACRRHLLARLMERLEPQLNDRIEVLAFVDNGERAIGAKRQRLLEMSLGQWVCFVDDDDLVSPDYCHRIAEALSHDPDVVGFRLIQYIDGELAAHAIHSVNAAGWRSRQEKNGLLKHDRTPNHLNPVRREMALSIGYKPQNVGEDADYAKRLRTAYPAMREQFVDADLYEYWYVTDRSHETRNHK